MSWNTKKHIAQEIPIWPSFIWLALPSFSRICLPLSISRWCNTYDGHCLLLLLPLPPISSMQAQAHIPTDWIFSISPPLGVSIYLLTVRPDRWYATFIAYLRAMKIVMHWYNIIILSFSLLSLSVSHTHMPSISPCVDRAYQVNI